MKFVIASDIHGSYDWCKKLIEAYLREKADGLILLGDILYHGPRNPLPDGYAPKKVAELLSEYKNRIICVRGNCDSEVDQMVLPFPVCADYGEVYADGVKIYLSHGHREVPPMPDNAVYITGHTHVPLNVKEDNFYHLNPGSVSLPKEESPRGYILFDGGNFYFKNLQGEIYDSLKI